METLTKELETNRDTLETMYSILRRSRKRKQSGPMTFVGCGERVVVTWDAWRDCPGKIVIESIKTGYKRIYNLEES